MNAPRTVTDAAWVTVDTAMDRAALAAFCADVERLFRINPLLEVKAWRPIAADRFDVIFKNLATRRELKTELTVQREASAVTVHYAGGLKRRTRFEVEALPPGSRLTVVDDYSGVEADEAHARKDEIDPTLTAWGHALHAYLARHRRWSRYAAWRWYMRRIWLPMTPSGRRITYMLWVVTAVEIAAIAAAIALLSA